MANWRPFAERIDKEQRQPHAGVTTPTSSGHVESLADVLRAFNYQNEVDVAYKAFYNRLARVGFATFTMFMTVTCEY